MLPEGTLMLPEGTLMLPEGTVMLPEGTYGKYAIIATRDGEVVKSEPRSTAEGAAALRAKWEAERFDVEVKQGKWPRG